MNITSLRVQSIRNHHDFSCVFSPNVTVVTGANGNGKTSLIEAIYIALQGTSFRGTDTEVLQTGTEWWRIDLGTDKGERIVRFEPTRLSRKKQFDIDGKTMARLSPAAKYPVVLFEPDDLRLLHGSPSRRRDFIDRFIAQIDPQYAQAIRRYDRALKQRNSLLKKEESTRDDLFVWDVALSEYGAQMIETRIAFIERINQYLNDTYHTIAQTNDAVSVHYSHTLIGSTKQRLVSELHARFTLDKQMGFTSIGPHRDDVLFRFNDKQALKIASRGEIRSIILALKFIEVDILSQTTGLMPIILLDDVFSELDSSRQTHLTTQFKNHQIIMTSASSTAALDDATVIDLA